MVLWLTFDKVFPVMFLPVAIVIRDPVGESVTSGSPSEDYHPLTVVHFFGTGPGIITITISRIQYRLEVVGYLT